MAQERRFITAGYHFAREQAGLQIQGWRLDLEGILANERPLHRPRGRRRVARGHPAVNPTILYDESVVGDAQILAGRTTRDQRSRSPPKSAARDHVFAADVRRACVERQHSQSAERRRQELTAGEVADGRARNGPWGDTNRRRYRRRKARLP